MLPLFCRMEAPPESITNILRELEADYHEMKRKVLAGEPLDQLRPLSVNSQRIASEAPYVPSKVRNL